jgi:SAM-dependent methyltransferase
MQGEHYEGLVAEWYDDWLAARTDDVEFYSGYFEGFRGSVLELACGTGRILLPIAKRGVTIHGLDGSEDMLRVLSGKAQRDGLGALQLHHQAMESFSLSTEFDAIFVASGSFQLLTAPGTALSSLACVRDHLTEGGFFLLDVFIPWDDIVTGGRSAYHVTRDVARPDGKRSIVLERFGIDLAKQMKLGTYRYEFYDHKRLESCVTDDLAIRWYWKEEFLTLLEVAGFAKVEVLTESPIHRDGHAFVFKAWK